MLEHLIAALTPLNLALALGGVAAGTIIGSIPGLTATMAVAVLVPVTFAMTPDSALILLGAIYTGAIYGGAYSAILLRTPGTPSAIATTFDGYPMAKRGDGDLAITLACLASVGGGLVGALALLFLAPPLADAALAFGPVEYFWLAMLGLSLISALSEGDFIKGLLGATLGLMLAMIGLSETSGEVRYTFGSQTLLGGIEVVSALIGLYCIPVLIDLAARPDRHLEEVGTPRGFRLAEATAVLMREKWNLMRSSSIGTIVGALPGAGGSIAGLIAYSEAKRTARKGETAYGEGAPGGIVATESSNNATVGGGFIPTLVLGIPGTPPDAVILGALLVQGVRTGPALFNDGGATVYTFIFGLLIATVLMLPVGLLIGRFAFRAIVKAPTAALVASVAFMTIIGSYAIRNNISDVYMMVLLGALGWVLSKRGFAVSPIVLGLILGQIAERGFVQSWTIGTALEDLPGQFFGRPISMVIIAMMLLTFLYPFMPLLKARLRGERAPLGPRAPWAAVRNDTISFGLFAALAIGALVLAEALNPEAAVFPQTIAWAMLVFAVIGLARLFLTRRVIASQVTGSVPRMILVPVVMMVAVVAVPVLGFGAAGLVLSLALVVVAGHGSPGVGVVAVRLAAVAAVAVLVTLGFREILSVPLPRGMLF
ncbi:tripartite tricarboxylate transporter permease [Halovulum dunhuangense]|uniref:Tripartite tricarboxylate transporter permease n=1 Tax=Halovulum dunhuangense TaxID=1505036 RepID=A0A849L2T0_9RHOB|nr:tripartite tricarboxylate transporter permease [Halovulum dunhuangense]NNU80501.1 tripartite tricarboxylate transporter permease [Halovulum dunhuangense]